MTRREMILIGAAVAALVATGLGGFLVGHIGSSPAAADMQSARKPLYWVSPMNPNYRSDKPGKSPMGMDLIPVYADGTGANADVQVSPAVVNNLGVRTAVVRKGSLSNRIEAVGYVGYDENTLASINTRAEGWIEKLGVKALGDRVRAGQRLYELFSPKLATAETEYLTALSSGMPDLVATARERLHALGFSVGQIRNLQKTRHASNRVARYAESDGVVVGLKVQEGAFVTPMMEVMKLADLNTVWVLAEVDQTDAAHLSVGQKAIAEFDAFPGQKWGGRVDYVYPDMSATTRTSKVRIRFDNTDGKLQPNMYAHVAILAAPDHNTVYIPSSALIHTGDSERVVVALGNGRFDVCPVEAGFQSGDMVEIRKGLVPGEKVVVSSQFMIDSEANVDAAALRLGANRPQCNGAERTVMKRQPAMPAGTKMPPGMKMPAQDKSFMAPGMQMPGRKGDTK